MDPLQLDVEFREITAAIRASEFRDSFVLIPVLAVRPGDFEQALLEHEPHIVHFSGHGSSNAEIIVHGKDGRPRPVSKEALIDLFGTLKDNIRVVVLNACWTRTQAEEISKTIDFTIGMNQPIGDAAAIVFAASFHRAIGFGRTMQQAFDLAKVALLLEGLPEDQTPTIYVRSGVDASTAVVLPRPRQDEGVQPPRQGDSGPTGPEAMDRPTFVRRIGGVISLNVSLARGFHRKRGDSHRTARVDP